ncbi:hypothetical protein RQP46_008565 [Phenoliferia psychrophenolica]
MQLHLADLSPAPAPASTVEAPVATGPPPLATAITAAVTAAATAAQSTTFRPLNVRDTLAYLDKIKQQFSEESEVYDQFLNIMKELKTQSIDTPGVIDRVSTLFRGHPSLIQGFNMFLPSGYRIECHVSIGNDKSARNTITITTPMGVTTRTQDVNAHEAREFVRNQLEGGTLAAAADSDPRSGSEPAEVSPSAPSAAAPPADNNETEPDVATSSGSPAPLPPSSTSAPSNASLSTSSSSQPQPRTSYWPQLQEVTIPSLPNPSPAPPLPPSAFSSLPNPTGSEGDTIDTPTPVTMEFNHAINYVNKIKNRYTNEPETYKAFLEILHTYKKEARPIQEVYTQVTELFQSAPDLLHEFKAFLPDTMGGPGEQAAAQRRGMDAPGGIGGVGGGLDKPTSSKAGDGVDRCLPTPIPSSPSQQV